MAAKWGQCGWDSLQTQDGKWIRGQAWFLKLNLWNSINQKLIESKIMMNIIFFNKTFPFQKFSTFHTQIKITQKT